MPGREDFAIIRARFLADARLHRAADLYVGAGLAVQETALPTVVGHVAMIGLWAVRETDCGILPGDGSAALAVAFMRETTWCKSVANCLLDAGLLRKEPNGIYLVGFRDCYAPIIAKRENARAYNRRKREKSEKRKGKRKRSDNVGSTSGLAPGNVTAHRTGSSTMSRTTAGASPAPVGATGSLPIASPSASLPPMPVLPPLPHDPHAVERLAYFRAVRDAGKAGLPIPPKPEFLR